MKTHSLIVSTLLVALSPVAHADLVATVCRGPSAGLVRAVDQGGGACTGFVVRTRTATKRVDFGRRASGDLLASADGRTVVMIDSYLYAGVARSGWIETFERTPVVDPPVVAIYRDGELVASHRIHALLSSDKRVERSISHIRWVKALPASVSGKTFTLRTLSGRDITFSSVTGAIVKVTEPAR